MENDALFEKLLTGNESPNQIVDGEDQEVGGTVVGDTLLLLPR